MSEAKIVFRMDYDDELQRESLLMQEERENFFTSHGQTALQRESVDRGEITVRQRKGERGWEGLRFGGR